MKWLKLKAKWKGNEAGKILMIEDDVQAKALVDADLGEETTDPTKDASKEITDQLTIQMKDFGSKIAQKAISDFLGAAGDDKGGTATKRISIVTHDNELDDPKLGFKSGMDFWHNFAVAHKGKDADLRESASKKIFGDGGYVKKLNARFKATGQSEAIDSEGGIFVLPEFHEGFLVTPAQLASFRKYARKFPMAGTSYSIRALVDKNHQTAVAGGVTVSRKGEGVSGDKSKAQWEWVTLKPTKQVGWVAITDEMLEDAPAFAGYFPPLFRRAIDSAEEGDFLYGSGAGEPLGAFHANNPSVITISKESGQAAGSLVILNILKARARCYGYESAVWFGNQDIIPQLAVMTIGNAAIYLPSAKEDVPDMLLGRPVKWTDHAETVGTKNDLMLCSGEHYAIGDRGGMNTAASIHVKFLEGEQVIKVWQRNDGQPLWRDKLTPVKGSTRSPFINIETRG
jgi:HK97 family phage major capsid protein